MKKLLITVAMLIGMIASTFAESDEVKITLDDMKLHYNYYSPLKYEGIIVDQASKLILVTENGVTLSLATNYKTESQKGYTSESLTVSFNLTEYESDLLKDSEVVEIKLQHANGSINSTIADK